MEDRNNIPLFKGTMIVAFVMSSFINLALTIDITLMSFLLIMFITSKIDTDNIIYLSNNDLNKEDIYFLGVCISIYFMGIVCAYKPIATLVGQL